MIRAVYDCNVILSGIGWNGSARKCLKLVAERRVFLFVTDELLAEYEAVIPETLAEEVPEVNPHPKLAWIKSKARMGEASPLGKRRSRDAKDDVYLAGSWV
jgi:predicted nucleic acid-binding protein